MPIDIFALEGVYVSALGARCPIPNMSDVTSSPDAAPQGHVLFVDDDEDVLKGFGAHSDQERISEESVYKHLQFYWNAVTAIAGAKF